MNNHTHITRVAIFLNHLAESSAPQAPQPLPLTPQPARPASLWGLGALLRTWASLGAHPAQAYTNTHSRRWPVYEGWELFWGRGHHWGHTLFRHFHIHTAEVGQSMGLRAFLRTWARLGARPVQAFPYTHTHTHAHTLTTHNTHDHVLQLWGLILRGTVHTIMVHNDKHVVCHAIGLILKTMTSAWCAMRLW